jgi:hypothetical protein
MALERPVVVSPGTNLDHLVERHTAGWVAHSAVPAVARALEAAAGAGERRLDETGARARSLVKSNFRLVDVIADLASIYEAVVRPKTRQDRL